MKLKYYLNGLLAALLLATASCSTDELVKTDGEQPEINADGTRTLKLRFEGFSIGTDKPETKAGNAIATDEENRVDDLLLLLATGDDPATAQMETWHYSKENLDVPDGVNKLLLTQDGKYLNGVIKTKLTGRIGAFILTNGLSISNTETPVKLEDQATEFHRIQTTPGTDPLLILSRKNADGLYRYQRLDLAAQPITTPLPMYKFRIDIPDNSTTIAIPLLRSVARFDLQNKIDNLRILRITPRNAVNTASMSGENPVRIDRMAPVTVYPGTTYDSEEAIDSQKVTSLFYTQGSPLNATTGQQPMTFEVEAILRDAAGNWVNKTYNLQLTRDGQQITIAPNTRYTIILSEATEQTLTGSILISDWNTGGQIDGEIGNTGAVPEFAFPEQAANMPTTLVGTSNQHIVVVDPKTTNGTIKLSIPNYKTEIAPGASESTIEEVMKHLDIDFISLDGESLNEWIEYNSPSPFALEGNALICTFEVREFGPSDNPKYPGMMIRVKNKINPAQYMAVKVISWIISDRVGFKDRYGNAGTENDPYEIHTTDDLLAMMGSPSSAFHNKFISLESDIDLSEYVFATGIQAPLVGMSAPDYGLDHCTFNGNNHTIRNFTLKQDINSSANNVGFFSCETTASTISDLSITGSITVNAASGNYTYQVGGITSNPSNDTYINCHSHIDITVNDAVPAEHENSVTGGITSGSNPVLIARCSNTGTIRSNSTYVGGITGILYELSSGDNPIVAGCFNSGTIIPGNTSLAGGIVGVVSSKNNIYISNCFNSSVINGGKGGAFGGFRLGSDLLTPGNIPAANIINCFYNTTGSTYENTWGTAVESDAMKTKDFANRLNDFSELLAVPGFDTYSPILNNCFQYKADSYPVLK